MTSSDLALIASLKSAQNRLGFAILLKSYALLNYPPRSKSEVPGAVVEWMAGQLDLPAESFGRYRWKGRVWKYHLALIRRHVSNRAFKEKDHRSLVEWLIARGNELFTRKRMLAAAVDYCRIQRLELPVESELRRLANSARRRFFAALFQAVFTKVEDGLRERMDALLSGDGSYDRLKQAAGRIGLKTLLSEIEKLQSIRVFGVRQEKHFAGVNPRIVQHLRNRARAEDAHQMQRHKPAVRYALLAALLHHRGMEVTDGVVQTFLELVRKIDKKTDAAVEKLVLDDVPRVFRKNHILYKVAKAVTGTPDGSVRDVVFASVDEKVFQLLVDEFEQEAPDYEASRAEVMRKKYAASYRRMLKPVLEILTFRSNSAVFQPLLDGIGIVRKFVTTKHVHYPANTEIPSALLTGNWASLIWEEGAGGRRAVKQHFELCVLQKLERATKCKEIWVEGSYRFRNPDEDMPADWPQHREAFYEKRGLPSDPDDFLKPLQEEMAKALEALNRFLGSRTSDVTITHPGGGERGIFKVPKLEKRPERVIIQEAKAGVQRTWGMLDLLDILVEADRRVQFNRFFHTSGQRQVLDSEEVRLRLLLTIFSLGTNVGLKRIHAATKPSCSYADLRYFRNRYLHADALREAIAALVNCILEARNPDIWGSGTACASDGKQLGAWDQNLMAEWHPHYHSRGIMVYWHVDTNALCIYSKLKTCSSSEVAAMVEGLVRHDTEMRVERNFVDSHGQSEVAFGFCRLLKIDLLPRLKRIKYERLYLPEKGLSAEFPHLRGVLERPIRWDLIREQYDEIVRHVVAIAEGTGPVDSIMRRFSSYNRNHPTYRASIELGKAQKTIFLCRYLQELALRQEIHEGLNVVENWNGTVDFVHFGRRSEFQTNDPELQELSMLCLHLLQNAIVLSNTLMLERVLQEDGLLGRMEPEDFRALTPLFTTHINPYGEFDLDLAKPSFLEPHTSELAGVA